MTSMENKNIQKIALIFGVAGGVMAVLLSIIYLPFYIVCDSFDYGLLIILFSAVGLVGTKRIKHKPGIAIAFLLFSAFGGFIFISAFIMPGFEIIALFFIVSSIFILTSLKINKIIKVISIILLILIILGIIYSVFFLFQDHHLGGLNLLNDIKIILTKYLTWNFDTCL